MSRSRLVVLASMTVVVLGVAFALAALVFGPARAAVGPLPAEGLALPADTRFVLGLDVKRFTASPFYERFARERALQPDTLRELQEKVGLDPKRDIDQIVFAGGEAKGGLALVFGRFDRGRIEAALEAENGKAVLGEHGGTTLYRLDRVTLKSAGEAAEDEADDDDAAEATETDSPATPAKRGDNSLAFFDDDTLLLGQTEAVKATLDNRAAGSGSLKTNASLLALLERVEPGVTFWMVGDRTLLARMPGSVPAPGVAGIELPALESLIVTGDLDPVVSLRVTGGARDAAAAQKLADVVRGFLALASLQAAQKPELQQLASAVSVTTEESNVRLEARLPYELIEALRSKQKPKPATEASDPK
jgi:hypothetical protein